MKLYNVLEYMQIATSKTKLDIYDNKLRIVLPSVVERFKTYHAQGIPVAAHTTKKRTWHPYKIKT